MTLSSDSGDESPPSPQNNRSRSERDDELSDAAADDSDSRRHSPHNMYREKSTRRSTPERSGDHTKPTYSSGSDDSSDGDSGSENGSESGEHNTDDVNAGHKGVLEAHRKEDPSSHLPTNAVAAAGVNTAISIPMRGQYMPPSMRRQMMAAAAEASVDNDGKQALADEVKQRESWELLKKRINGPINKVNTSNIKEILIELFLANLIRGRGLFCRSVIKAQSLSRPFTPVYAALVAVINTKLPIVGELLLTRLVLQFRRAFGRDDKDKCLPAIMFIAHLTNQRVAHEVLALQILTLLLENPTDDSVEIAVSFMREVGALLAEIVPRVLNAVFDTFRSILHDADIDKRVQYMIEVLFQYRRDGFKENPVIPDGLDLVEVEEQIVHEVALDDDDLDGQDELNVFRRDDNFEDNERKYDDIKREILGDGDDSEVSEEDSGGESGLESDTESGSESEAEGIEGKVEGGAVLAKSGLETPATQRIHDLTETEMVNLRRTIYLAIMSSLSFEEAAHKLLKIEIRPGEEQELCNMVIECCSQERTYKTFFGLIGERLCKVNRTWAKGFSLAFGSCYECIHRYETNHIRNIAHFFAHLLASDALRWSILEVVILTEEATTSSSRIFLKILLQDLAESLGLKTLSERLKSTEPQMSKAVNGMFPSDSAKSTRFAINYYTSIGLGAITEEMREWLKSVPNPAAASSDSGSESDTGSSSYTSSSGYSRSGSDSSSGSDSDSRASSRSYSSSGSDSDSSDKGSGSESESDLRRSRRHNALQAEEEKQTAGNMASTLIENKSMEAQTNSEHASSLAITGSALSDQHKAQPNASPLPRTSYKPSHRPSSSSKSPVRKRGRSESSDGNSSDNETKTAMRGLDIGGGHDEVKSLENRAETSKTLHSRMLHQRSPNSDQRSGSRDHYSRSTNLHSSTKGTHDRHHHSRDDDDRNRDHTNYRSNSGRRNYKYDRDHRERYYPRSRSPRRRYDSYSSRSDRRK